MIRCAALVALLAVATGCVTTADAPPDVGNFKGQASQPLLAKLGPPDSQDSVGGGTVYRWRTSIVQESAPVTTTTVNYSSGSGLPSAVPVTTFEPQTQRCMLTLTADAAGRVTDLSRDGSRQACAPLLDRLGTR
jgi:hypothetical protein